MVKQRDETLVTMQAAAEKNLSWRDDLQKAKARQNLPDLAENGFRVAKTAAIASGSLT